MIVIVEWLCEYIEDENVCIIDCCFDLVNFNWGREKYEEGYIFYVLYFDLNLDLLSFIVEYGGCYFLLNIEEFVDKFLEVGIDEYMIVIVYDS